MSRPKVRRGWTGPTGTVLRLTNGCIAAVVGELQGEYYWLPGTFDVADGPSEWFEYKEQAQAAAEDALRAAGYEFEEATE